MILDRDAKFNDDVITFLKATGLKPKRTSVQAPWQNGIAERWVGSCRREILDHVIPLNEEHFRRLIRDYAGYYHEDRTHDSLEKDTPQQRPVEAKPGENATVISMSRLGGLRHRAGGKIGISLLLPLISSHSKAASTTTFDCCIASPALRTWFLATHNLCMANS